MSERVYVAASFEQRGEVRALCERIRASGHTVTVDWTIHEEITGLRSAKERRALKRQYAVEDTDGVRTASVYVLLLGERKSTGAHIEFGIALGGGVPHICLVGKADDSQLFYAHPAVSAYPNTDAFIKMLNDI